MTTLQLHTHNLKKIAEILANEIEDGKIKSKSDLLKRKKILAKQFSLKILPSNSQLFSFIKDKQKERVKKIFQRKPSRTLSGVAIIAVMTSPFPCPHGKCTPCPGGPPSTPQSYTGKEPASLRAERNKFDAYKQVTDRLKQLEIIGHPTDKIDLILMGGTFPARDTFYQREFVKKCYDALNNSNSSCLEEAKRLNERAKRRCIGLTIETRPDWCRIWHIDLMLELGATRVEIGAQILDDKILEKMERGHTVIDTIRATKLAKDAGLKVCYHIMPGLPGSDYKNDIHSFKKMFTDTNFMPDMLKIYPTLVVKGSKLYKEWKKGIYEPLKEEDAIRLIAEMKKYVPEWVRIQRIERDIPSYMIEDGIKKSNLRQIVHEYMKENDLKCRCIRCREIGRVKNRINEDLEIRKREYVASYGREIFLSIENDEAIVAYCRLRIPDRGYKEEMENASIVRELKVHGSMVEIGKRYDEGWQHRGYGKILMEKAEEISLSFKKEKLLVLSGVGAKEYYRKLGYEDYSVYMKKDLID
ncbi:MAG TPA: tRNA uridine(34) 5-carboxymethylaminomethyl modification radical SAM/GNAT enzyme Elp3 [Thermoplasmatales archaeon]|nr:tRNA uridine(34) 5-carboxymethylaminomethyl modification radical SAM/GNAT enzyme Elp3 [Thermoplasmatales archaeon]